jgi:hypothetical protein
VALLFYELATISFIFMLLFEPNSDAEVSRDLMIRLDTTTQ